MAEELAVVRLLSISIELFLRLSYSCKRVS